MGVLLSSCYNPWVVGTELPWPGQVHQQSQATPATRLQGVSCRDAIDVSVSIGPDPDCTNIEQC